ncbi:hypothetical protein [Demetria terragena]|uniref:hypothetical protein n=1 Tax=Demetria terragena TaxID=63959 RepID=UPI0003A61963|nr:hypothetical protein [Demetria terragena]
MFRNIGLILLLVVVLSVVWFFIKGRVTGTQQRVRDRALEGNFGRAATARPASKHVAMMGRTLTLNTDPQRAGELIAHVAGSDDRVTDVRPEPGVLVVEIDGSHPLVRAHLLEDRTVIGVDEFTWEMGFPQGASVWDRVASAINTAAHAQGIPAAEGEREFVAADRPDGTAEMWVVREVH